ncbi:DUF6932 family protein [Luteibacter aegosomatissinici]|uniref:DUF6932 family protein n=1 Tax=Luteibacter aegosomatissinici TaxID=2911539 RepID=UPI001FFB068F|nr:hypothetical protein [Luteibacter aegosomatissinici]UPG94013.1 hypothetical protein L2Y97_19660 [Luteibacter aegosomatissinici]
MIPAFTSDGLLPPTSGSRVLPAELSPHATHIVDFIERFGGTLHRRQLLRGFLRYRRELWEFGLRDGFQWIDGSFVEDSEATRGQPPADLDVVTFAPLLASRPCREQLFDALSEKTSLFSSHGVRSTFGCDAYFVDTTMPPMQLISHASYWLGLFGHQRDTNTWKGILRIDLGDDGDMLEQLEAKDDTH